VLLYPRRRAIDPITILASLVPVAVDLGKSLISRFVAPEEFKPATIEQYIQMKQMDLEQFKAINDAGGTNPTYPWVEAITRLMRPTVGLIVLSIWAYTKISGHPSNSVDNFASAIGFYLFGDRSLFYAKQVK